jgi:hypothetical protein
MAIAALQEIIPTTVAVGPEFAGSIFAKSGSFRFTEPSKRKTKTQTFPHGRDARAGTLMRNVTIGGRRCRDIALGESVQCNHAHRTPSKELNIEI